MHRIMILAWMVFFNAAQNSSCTREQRRMYYQNILAKHVLGTTKHNKKQAACIVHLLARLGKKDALARKKNYHIIFPQWEKKRPQKISTVIAAPTPNTSHGLSPLVFSSDHLEYYDCIVHSKDQVTSNFFLPFVLSGSCAITDHSAND